MWALFDKIQYWLSINWRELFTWPSTTVGNRSAWDYYNEIWPVDPLLLGWVPACCYVQENQGRNSHMTSELRQLIELWLEESHKHDAEQKKEDERRNCTCNCNIETWNLLSIKLIFSGTCLHRIHKIT